MAINLARIGTGLLTAGQSEILPAFAGQLSGADDAEERAKKLEDDTYYQREAAKQKQYELLGSLKAPETSESMERRIRALEDQSQAGPLSQDPYFQGARANLVQGGEQALAGVQNQQAARDNSGGFANQGSIHDVYDRLGAQLANLGEHSVQVKDQKAQMAAQARQSIVDNQIAFQNHVAQAKMAIESGDSAAAMASIQAAYNARENIAQATRQMEASLISAGTSVGASALTGKPKASEPVDQSTSGGNNFSSNTNRTNSTDPFGANSGDYYAQLAKQPWAYQR